MLDLNKEEEVQIRLGEILNQMKVKKKDVKMYMVEISRYEKVDKE